MKISSRETTRLVKTVPERHMAMPTAAAVKKEAASMLKSITHTLVKLIEQYCERSRCPATAVREEMTEAAITQVITAAKKLKKRDRRVLGRE